MRPIRIFAFLSMILVFSAPSLLPADDLNDVAYENRIHLQAGTIWNTENKGDCLLFPYFDVRKAGGKTQVNQIQIENFGEYGIAAKLRFKDWARGKEIFSKDIWIPSKGSWSAKVELTQDGTNALITSQGNIIWRYDTGAFYFTNSLMGGAAFSIRNIRKGMGETTLYGFVEVIGEEKTTPGDTGGKTGRLAKSERDCPNTLRGTLTISRTEGGTAMTYSAVAIGNFSRGQGSLFRSPGSPYPKLDNGEDSLDQLEFQLSKFEVFGPFSVNPSKDEKTSLIVTYPTKTFHYPHGRRSSEINNPFEALNEIKGETLLSALSKDGESLNSDSEMVLPYAVNIIGLYPGSPNPPAGIDNLSLPVYSHESGEVKLTSDNMAQRVLIQDFEYFREVFTTYRGLPALGLLLREYRNPDVLHTDIVPTEFSAVWESSLVESIIFPNLISGPSYGLPDEDYTYTVGGAYSSIGHPIQYFIDWGDGSTDVAVDDDWLPVGVTSAAHHWADGGLYYIRAMARCALNPGIQSKWSQPFLVRIESVSIPSILSGPVVGLPNVPYTYTTGGASTSVGHPVQYLFDWDDGSDSNWLPVGVTSATKAWIEGKNYNVKAKARCATDPLIESEFSAPLVVKIEFISAPSTPVGLTKGLPGDTFTFSTGGASSNIGDPVEYQFDWGDGTFSSWVSTPTATKKWTVGERYTVRARARCAVHPSIMSDWSAGLTVDIEFISKPATPSGPDHGIPYVSYTYTISGATSNIGDPVEYFFDWGDGTSSGWIKPDSTGKATASHSWQPDYYGQGIYTVKVKARCATHTYIESVWSDVLEVEIEAVSPPTTPEGVTEGLINTPYSFTTGGAQSNLAHALEYQFDWGDGTQSLWTAPSTDGTVTLSRQWRTTGTFSITARARCKEHQQAVSNPSEVLSIKISEPPGP